MSVDIVIPVYNAFDYVKKCTESIIQYTESNQYRLVLVNDCSTDSRVEEYLHKITSERVILLNNERNLGFVSSVNRGMQYSQNDVVLLNSDTEVTSGWLDKLVRCAYQDEKTATVTPLTNSGTICSVPEFCHDNPLPEGLSADEFSNLIDRISLHQYPEIPTAVGFCMYIKRSVLDEIGYFDEKAFGKGYGEENDFCYRAIKAGYTNRLCDDAFIYHKGSMSFGNDKKNSQISKNTAVLDSRYPKERRRTLEFCRLNPIKSIGDNINLHLSFCNGKKNILMILHMPVPYRKGDSKAGGTQKHVMELTRYLSAYYNIFICWPEMESGLCLIGYNDKEFREFYYPFHNKQEYGGETDRIIQNIIKGFSVDLVHIHHVMNMGLHVFESVNQTGVPCVFTAHDYYLMCPNVNLLRDGVYCKEDLQNCDRCLERPEGSAAARRKRAEKALEICRAVVTPDESVSKLYKKAFPTVQVQVIEHGTLLPSEKLDDPVQTEKDSFRVAFVGTFSRHKGSKVMERVVNGCADERIEWHLFGEIADKTIRIDTAKAIIHGPYAGGEIINLLRNYGIHLVCFFPLWPETYSYVLTECWAAGVPVLAYDIGAVGERLRKNGYGYLLPPGTDAGVIIKRIEEIARNREEYESKREALKNFAMFSPEDMAEAYRRLYESLFEERQGEPADFDAGQILKAYYDAKKGTETLGIAYGEELEGMRSKIRKFLPGFAADFILRGNYPFKRSLKRLAAGLKKKI